MSTKLPTIATNIRKYRAERQLSQEKLARLADVSLPTVTKIESGETPNPTIDTIKRIAIVLEVSIDDLIN